MEPKTTILICLNGRPPAGSLLTGIHARMLDLCWPTHTKVEQLIAADGAGNACAHLQIQTDVVLGDLDSITEEALTRLEQRGTRILHIPDQEDSDLAKSMEFARSQHPEHITLAGWTGHRMDHWLVVPAFLSGLDTAVSLISDAEVIHCLPAGTYRFRLRPQQRVSLITYHPDGVRVDFPGLEYSVRDLLLKPGTHGVSNRALQEGIYEVRIGGGNLFLYLGMELHD